MKETNNGVKYIYLMKMQDNTFFVHRVESRFLKPPGETQTGSRSRRVREIGGKIAVFD